MKQNPEEIIAMVVGALKDCDTKLDELNHKLLDISLEIAVEYDKIRDARGAMILALQRMGVDIEPFVNKEDEHVRAKAFQDRPV